MSSNELVQEFSKLYMTNSISYYILNLKDILNKLLMVNTLYLQKLLVTKFEEFVEYRLSLENKAYVIFSILSE